MDVEGELNLQILREVFEQIINLVVLSQEGAICVFLKIVEYSLAELVSNRWFLNEALHCFQFLRYEVAFSVVSTEQVG